MKKKGFTLVELLAVIAILSILAVLIWPNVLNMFNSGKRDAFKIQVDSVIRAAEAQKQSDTMGGNNVPGYCYGIGAVCPSGMELSVNETDVKYAVMFGNDGKVNRIGVENTNYCYVSDPYNSNIDENDFVSGAHLSCTNSGCTCTK